MEDEKADDVITYSGPDDKPEKSPFAEAARRSNAFETVVYPLASLEERIEIPEGREAWNDHRLHTERARRDDRELSAQRVVAKHGDHEKFIDDDCSRRYRQNDTQVLGERWCAGDVNEVVREVPQRFPSLHRAPAVAEFGAGAERLDHGLDQKVADENSVRSQSHREDAQEIAQLSSGQDATTNDHVGRIQGVVQVWLCDCVMTPSL